MPTTMTLINTVTVGSGGATNITFSSIPQTYTDLCVKYSSRGSSGTAAAYAFMTFNSSTSNYVIRRLYGYSSSAGADASSAYNNGAILVGGSDMSAGAYGVGEIYIPSYRSSIYKATSNDAVDANNGAGGFRFLTALTWQDNSAITSINFEKEVGSFAQYSTFSLYGIKNS